MLVTSQHGNKSRSCCHKTQPLRPAFKCCLYSPRAADTLQKGEREKEEERLGEKRERERERDREVRGFRRPVAEGLILNVLQRQCLLSSLASPLTAPASKQDLSPLPPFPTEKGGRKQERRWLLKMTGPLPFVCSKKAQPVPALDSHCHCLLLMNNISSHAVYPNYKKNVLPR